MDTCDTFKETGTLQADLCQKRENLSQICLVQEYFSMPHPVHLWFGLFSEAQALQLPVFLFSFVTDIHDFSCLNVAQDVPGC